MSNRILIIFLTENSAQRYMFLLNCANFRFFVVHNLDFLLCKFVNGEWRVVSFLSVKVVSWELGVLSCEF